MATVCDVPGCGQIAVKVVVELTCHNPEPAGIKMVVRAADLCADHVAEMNATLRKMFVE
jgi:hypothetical protein